MKLIVFSLHQTLFLDFPFDSISVFDLKSSIQSIDGIPIDEQRVKYSSKQLNDSFLLSSNHSGFLEISLRLIGGKGGFGALLKGGSTGVSAKKTTNKGACRDLTTGRRLRHMNYEKKLEEWKDEEEEREMEKKALDFVKKRELERKKTFNETLYNQVSDEITQEVSSAIRETLSKGKQITTSTTLTDQSTRKLFWFVLFLLFHFINFYYYY